MTEATRERIQQTALEMFLSQGFEATSMDAIADAVGITKPAIYYHFGSKQELFLDLLGGLFEGMIAEYLRTLGAEPSLRDLLGGVFRMIGDIESTFGDGGGSLDVGYVSLLVDAARRFPDEVGETVDGFYGEMRDLLTGRVRLAQESGEVRQDVDPEAFSLAVVALVEGLLLVGSLAPSCDYRGREQGLIDVLWTGIARETE